MYVVKSGQNLVIIGRFAQMAKRLGSNTAKRELFRGVVDAGRRMKTDTQKVVTEQMALKRGLYQSYVVANTRGVGSQALLAYDIYSSKGGIKVQNYKGLKSLKGGGRVAKKLNAGRAAFDKGTVRSAVWNNPRVFKRSFEVDGSFYMMRSAESGVRAPRILWTHDNRSWQPRTAQGRFASTGAKWGKIRQLYGPALGKEIPDGPSAANFMARAPLVLEAAVTPRIAKLLRY